MIKEKDTDIQKVILSLAYTNFNKSLSTHVLYKINNKEICADLVQETFMRTWMYLIKGGEIVLMRAFLYHILNNLIIDEYRKKKNLSLDELVEKGYELKFADQNERFVNILDGQIAIDLITDLPEKYKEIIHMKYVQELSLQEISIITGKNKNLLAVQMHRGLEKLKIIYNKTKIEIIV